LAIIFTVKNIKQTIKEKVWNLEINFGSAKLNANLHSKNIQELFVSLTIVFGLTSKTLTGYVPICA